jgi:hypothetical protein
MKRTLFVFAMAAVAAIAIPAHAAIYSANFTGIVDESQGNTGQAIGNTVSGYFDLDSSTGNFLDFTIGGLSVPAGYESFAGIGPALYDAIYTAQVSPVSSGTSTNSTFSLDLSSLTTWPVTDTAYTLLTDTSQLTTNLDSFDNPLSAFPSTFSYYTANADGTDVVSLGANLTSISATATPEPASFTLLASSLLGLGFFVRVRRT